MALAVGVSCTTLDCFVPELQRLTPQAPRGIGRQDFSRGCLLALNESLQVRDGELAFTDKCFFNNPPACDDISVIQDAAIYGPLCGTNASVPEVVVPYSWCARNCPGWQRSEPTSLSQWIGPLVQFILPCLAFCLSIPRSWKFAVPKEVFASQTEKLDGLFSYLVYLPLALTVVTLDTTFWLSICFAFAGPMLLSAVYEYTLDRKIIDYLSSDILLATRALPPDAVATFLLCTLVGNLKFEARDAAVANGQLDSPQQSRDLALSSPVAPTSQEGPLATWAHIMQIADEFQPTPAREMVARTIHDLVASSQSVQEHDKLKQVQDLMDRAVKPEYKLKALLNAQSSFGGAVGAPVIFFIGGFIYNVLDARSSPGDQDTALSLAFGMWWMVIPHTAVIACAMLASNNPSTLQGIIGRVGDATAHAPAGGAGGHRRAGGPAAAWRAGLARAFGRLLLVGDGAGDGDEAARRLLRRLFRRLAGVVENAYDSDFEPVTLWRRGPNKQRWIAEAVRRLKAPGRWRGRAAVLADLERHFRLTAKNWLFMMAALLLVLLGVPFSFAFVTSYMTPQYGLSCRSTTHLMYFLAQVLQVCLWLPTYYMDRSRVPRWGIWLARFLQLLAGLFAVIAAVGGTLMQIIGVYNNCQCKINLQYWGRRDAPDALVSLRTSTQAGVHAARYWMAFGGTVSGVLGGVTAVAWWHQRRLRRKFLDLLRTLEQERRLQKLAPHDGAAPTTP